jgi:hypothetical protein
MPRVTNTLVGCFIVSIGRCKEVPPDADSTPQLAEKTLGVMQQALKAQIQVRMRFVSVGRSMSHLSANGRS